MITFLEGMKKHVQKLLLSDKLKIKKVYMMMCFLKLCYSVGTETKFYLKVLRQQYKMQKQIQNLIRIFKKTAVISES